MTVDLPALKSLARAYWHACDTGGDIAPFLADRVLWEGPKPAPEARSPAELTDGWLAPFRAAFPDLRRETHILMAGPSSGRADGGPDGRLWVSGTGYLHGRARQPLFGIPATDRPLRLRWGEALCIEDGRITEAQMLIDLIDWFEQIGRPVLPPSLGDPGIWPAPTAFDGLHHASGPEDTAQTLQLGRDLIFGGLNIFDEAALDSMGMARFFHPNLRWYGPGGIGACFSLEEFETRHQKPWLDSFPDRKVQDLPSLVAEGRLLAASGTAGVRATHGGLPFRGSGPGQGQPIRFSGLDWWLRTGDRFTENWVFVDFIDLFDQLGIDLMDRMSQS